MPAQDTMPSKTLKYHGWRNQDIPRQNQINTVSFHKSSPTKDNRWKTPTQGVKLHPRKSKKVIFQQTHTNIILPLTRKLTGTNNHFSLISLNMKINSTNISQSIEVQKYEELEICWLSSSGLSNLVLGEISPILYNPYILSACLYITISCCVSHNGLEITLILSQPLY